MNVLVVGGGGREHAICWKLAQSEMLDRLYCAPGNPGIAQVAERVPIQADDLSGVVDFARARAIGLVVIGPELPLTLGLADQLRREGVAVFGPSAAAARLEGSKVFAKEFMSRHGIPTADFEVAESPEAVREAVKRFGFPVVLKADGLAAGKGVVLPANEAELEEALSMFFEQRLFGNSADRVLVEECLVGEEVSFIAISDGERLLPFASSKDYKRVGDGDQGPNTGGMGAHSPSGLLAQSDVDELMRLSLVPVVRGMAEESDGFQGFLYAGLMLTEDGPRVLEFNVRLGDPEAQPLLMRLEDDLLQVLAGGARGEFPLEQLSSRNEAAVCLVLAADGYPGRAHKDDLIQGVEAAAAVEGVVLFHAGTGEKEGRLVTAGGRVLNVCALGETLEAALARAYEAAELIEWPGRQLRTDIGRGVLERTAKLKG